MKAVIVGCGRVGAGLADELDRAGWQVLIIDLAASAFDRLPASFGGLALRGDGTDEDTLLRAGAQGADLFLALTEGDNRNVMAAQLGVEALGVRQCIAKINDPVRAEAYAHLGIASLCRTNLMMTSVLEHMGQATPARPGIYAPIASHPHLGGDAAATDASADATGTGSGSLAVAGATPSEPGPAAGSVPAAEPGPAAGSVPHPETSRPPRPGPDSTAPEG
jgi:trk/ktr system potassium uptake protein